MPISLEQPAIPSVKLRNIGDEVVIAIAHAKVVPWREYGTNNVKVGADGKPRTQDCVTGIVVRGTGVVTRNDQDEVVKPGEEVAIYLAGHNRWEYIEAKRKLGGLNVGDVLQWKYDRDEPSQSGNPKKVRTCAMRRAKPEEAATVAACEALYSRLTLAATVLESVATVPVEDDEEPF